MFVYKNVKMDNKHVFVLMSWVTLTSTIMGILSPLLVIRYESDYYVLFAISIEFFILFGIMFLCVKEKTKMLKWKLIVQLGIFNAYMAITLLYASDPTRTPPVMQSTLTGLAIVPSAIFRKIAFPKSIKYNMIYITISCIFLLCSVIISGIPIASNSDIYSFWWCLIYISGVCARSYYNVIQEKYVRCTEYVDNKILSSREKLDNRIRLSFYSRFFAIITIIPAFAFEWIQNTGIIPFEDFYDSFAESVQYNSSAVMLQGFILCYFGLFFSAIYLNAISTNYHMILTAICNPSVALFFTIFPELNTGIQYPIWSTIFSLVFSFLSIVFWMKGDISNVENKEERKLLNPSVNGSFTSYSDKA